MTTIPGGGAAPAPCPCGSGLDLAACCAPFLDGSSLPPTAEALMRSRYSAYALRQLEYLETTLHPDHRADYDPKATRQWSQKADWLGLEILSTEDGKEGDEAGLVEFVARYRMGGERLDHRELASFSRKDGRWYFVEGRSPRPKTVVSEEPKAGRNEPCPCGSGRKYKKCCAA